MIDKQELQRTFERFDHPEPAYDRLLDRRRRRERRRRIEAGVAVVVVLAAVGALVAGSFARREEPMPNTQPPTDRPAPPWTEAAIGTVVVTNPGDWHLTGYFHGDVQDVVLATFAPDLSAPDPCSGMPGYGAILRLHAGGAGGPDNPPPLTGGSPSDLACGGDQLSSAWSEHGRDWEAIATFGPDASASTRTALEEAFAGLSFLSTSNWNTPYCSYHQPFGAEVLASSGTDWTLYEMTTSRCAGGGFMVSSSQGHGESIWWPAGSPTDHLDIHDWKFGEDSIVVGTVPSTVTAVRLTTMDGRVVDADLVASATVAPGAHAYVAVFDDLASGTIETFDAAGSRLDSARFAAGQQCQGTPGNCAAAVTPGQTIATGDDGRGGRWALRARAGEIAVYDDSGASIASVPTHDPAMATAPLPAASEGLLFGVAPAGTAIVLREIPHVGWGFASTAELDDGTIVFWATADTTTSITAADANCQPIQGFDPSGGSAIPADQHACLGSDGGN